MFADITLVSERINNCIEYKVSERHSEPELRNKIVGYIFSQPADFLEKRYDRWWVKVVDGNSGIYESRYFVNLKSAEYYLLSLTIERLTEQYYLQIEMLDKR